MAKRAKTGFDLYFKEQMQDPEVRAGYEAARARINMIDSLVRALDRAREEQGLSKADLARRIGAEPAAVRRLLTAPKPNPTMTTFVGAADALGLEIRVARKKTKSTRTAQSRIRRQAIPA